MDLANIYRTFHPNTDDYKLFLASQGTFSKVDHKVSLNRAYKGLWKPNNTLLNEEWVLEETKQKLFKFLESNENETTTYQNLRDTIKQPMKKAHSSESLH